MKYRAVIFDMDGTLLNTLEDLRDSLNYALEKKGYPGRTLDEVRSFLGNGARVLLERATPENISKEDFNETYEIYSEYYLEHCRIKTRPYDGVMELLKKLSENGYKLAIVSNKGQDAVSELSKLYFGDYVETAIGENEKAGIKKKPAPDTVFKALEILGCKASEAVYVGDSEVDRKTAENSGMDCISVTWGFRDRELLEELKPYAIVDEPVQILEFV